MSNIKPLVQFICLRDAISSDKVTNLDVVVRITVPEIKTNQKRPMLNLGLVIDRSGSMHGAKMEYARQAAIYGVQQLLECDRLSVTIYDDEVEVIIPSQQVKDKSDIINRIKRIQPDGMTALYDGWLEGATQVSQHLQPESLNRVILLSDGLANVGETNPDVIGNDVHGLSKRGVSTTTMGIGDDFNEDLMQGIALSGDGNYYYIQNPDQLPTIFNAELQGIMATIGQRVSLGVRTFAGVELVDVFNDLEKTEYGNYKLPNLIAGNEFDMVLRLKIPAMAKSECLVNFRLAYDDSETQSRKVSHHKLQLPVVNSAQLHDYPFNEKVKTKVAQLVASRAKEEAVRNLDRGDIQGTRERLQMAKQEMMDSGISLEMMAPEMAEMDDLLQDLDEGKTKSMRKNAQFQNYNKRRSRP
ncbi:VWA domain-containing protein [Cyanobacterium stanieri LEGE 03274]|uniref:VWA domain-containing protein n=1 Tax=Cyanobacterium stanieri LEGE 03274 TaxID=1828756 RepID=A0ABR9V4C9_9CHRO|nr:VWA domain-containing protein [Cyanobacterium stanieri]MBE9222391.1 VWA domain-containing protein [Cyanobacterium stanieri LEGE 03274]